MRTLMQPPPMTRCDRCGGELLLKLVESANRALDLENEIFLCASCGREISFTVNRDRYAAHNTPGTPHTDAESTKY
jgi:DNA-directed RNA polymerase subunit RPC12/RpoP